MSPRSQPVLTPSLRRFLARPRLARLCTISSDGYPHIVPIYFGREGDDLIFGTDHHEAKVRKALRDPRSAVVIGGDPDRDDAGYRIQGDLVVEEHPRQAVIRRLLLRYETSAEAEEQLEGWGEGKVVLLRLKPRRVIRV